MNLKEALIAHLQGQKVEVKTFKHWEPLTHWASRCGASLLVAIADSDFATACEFRLAPHTIKVNGVEVPAPEKDVPNNGDKVFVADPCNKDFYYPMTWYGIGENYTALNRKLIYLNKEDAIARAKAMLIYKEV